MLRNTILNVWGFDAVGQIVTWISQSQGVEKVKTGRIEAFVPAFDHPRKYFNPEAIGVKKTRLKFDLIPTQNARYIVAVPRNPDAPDPYSPENVDYYAPKAKWFEGEVGRRPLRSIYTVVLYVLPPGADPTKVEGDPFDGWTGIQSADTARYVGMLQIKKNRQTLAPYDIRLVVYEDRYRPTRGKPVILVRKMVEEEIIKGEQLETLKNILSSS